MFIEALCVARTILDPEILNRFLTVAAHANVAMHEVLFTLVDVSGCSAAPCVVPDELLGCASSRSGVMDQPVPKRS